MLKDNSVVWNGYGTDMANAWTRPELNIDMWYTSIMELREVSDLRLIWILSLANIGLAVTSQSNIENYGTWPVT